MKAIMIGLLASFFFAVTFTLNRSMDLDGGSWIWSSSLRFFFMIPLLLVIVMARGNHRELFAAMRENPWYWLKWSFVGFVLFYAPITYAASSGPGWLVAGTWQITIVCGMLLAPLFYHQEGDVKIRQQIPFKSMLTSLIILAGVGLIQFQQTDGVTNAMLVTSVVPVLVAAFAYPLGNRKMMEGYGGRIDPFQRVLGMTIGSLPFWVILAGYGLFSTGAPSASQTVQTFLVAISSGIIATVLFFWATDMVRNDQKKLAAVEATQSGEVLFAVLGEMVILSAGFPSAVSAVGLLTIIFGMIVHSFVSQTSERPKRASGVATEAGEVVQSE